MKNLIIKICIGGVIFIIISTILIAVIVSTPSSYDISVNNDWIGYYSAILGSILTSLISIIGIFITIDYYRTKDINDRHLEQDKSHMLIIPYFHYLKDITKSENMIPDIKISYSPSRTKATPYTKHVTIENIGNGPAIGGHLIIPKEYLKEEDNTSFSCKRDGRITFVFKFDLNSFPLGFSDELVVEFMDMKGKKYTQSLWFSKIINSANNDVIEFKLDSKIQ